jgi:hypothetical protein
LFELFSYECGETGYGFFSCSPLASFPGYIIVDFIKILDPNRLTFFSENRGSHLSPVESDRLHGKTAEGEEVSGHIGPQGRSSTRPQQ